MAGISGPRGGASHSRLRRVADPYASRMGEALWQTRLRWRLRGAMLWPAFVGRRRRRGRAARPAARGRRPRPGAVRRRAARRLPQPRPRRGRRAAGRALAAPPPARDAVGDRHRPGGHRAARAGRARCVVALGLLHHSSVRAAREDLNAQAASARRFFISQAPREFQANVDHLDTVKQGDHLYRTCVAGARPRTRLLRLRQHRPVAAGRHPRPRPAAQRGGGAVGAVSCRPRRVGGAACAYSITEGKRTRGGATAGGRPRRASTGLLACVAPGRTSQHGGRVAVLPATA